MKLTHDELEFLSAWAREEWEPACYQQPAHRIQLSHGVPGTQLIALIKVWAEGEGKKDRDILDVAANSRTPWPWPTAEDFGARYAEAIRWRAQRKRPKAASGAGGKGARAIRQSESGGF
jgi:hypothetical protein